MIINRKSGGRSQSPALCVSCKIGASFVLPLASVGIHFWGSYKKGEEAEKGGGGRVPGKVRSESREKDGAAKKKEGSG